MRFEFHDTTGKVRNINADLTLDELRVRLGEFRTECYTQNKAYEYNHFVNWLKKYYHVDVTYEPLTAERVDM